MQQGADTCSNGLQAGTQTLSRRNGVQPASSLVAHNDILQVRSICFEVIFSACCCHRAKTPEWFDCGSCRSITLSEHG